MWWKHCYELATYSYKLANRYYEFANTAVTNLQKVPHSQIVNNSKIATNQQIVPHIFYLTPAACDRRYVCNFLASCTLCLYFVYIYLAQKPDILYKPLLRPWQARFLKGNSYYFWQSEDSNDWKLSLIETLCCPAPSWTFQWFNALTKAVFDWTLRGHAL